MSYKKVLKTELSKHSKVVNGTRYLKEGIHTLDRYELTSEDELQLFDDTSQLIRINNSNYQFQNIVR